VRGRCGIDCIFWAWVSGTPRYSAWVAHRCRCRSCCLDIYRHWHRQIDQTESYMVAMLTVRGRCGTVSIYGAYVMGTSPEPGSVGHSCCCCSCCFDTYRCWVHQIDQIEFRNSDLQNYAISRGFARTNADLRKTECQSASGEGTENKSCRY
jgi:hypothetical protein